MKTFVFSKDPQTDTEVLADISELLKFGETLVSVMPQAVTPVSVPPLTVTQLSAIDSPSVQLLLTGSAVNVTYGFLLLIQTDARVLTAQVAVSAIDSNFIPYTTQDPNAYTDLVDTIQAGQSAIGTAIFMFPIATDPAGGYVNWEFMDAQGIVYASGNAYDYQIQSNGLANTVLARAIINVPTSVPPSDVNSKYQLRYTLTLPQAQLTGGQSAYYSAENVTVTGLTTTPLGTQDQIETRGKPAKLSIVLDRLYDQVVLEIYKDNTLIGSAPISTYDRVGSGYYYAGTIDTAPLTESLEPYNVVWNYSNAVDPNTVFSETANLWIANPAILGAVNDVKAKVNKARTTLYGTSDLIFPSEVIMLWLRRAADAFNGYAGVFTNFTFINAKGAVREYWLAFAEMAALDSQYLAEGEKAFDFQGAAISLTVDRTQFLDSMSSKIQGRLDNEFKPFKQNLIIKGNTGGDGSADPTKLARGAIGAVGITITPASPWGPYRSGLPYPQTNIIG